MNIVGDEFLAANILLDKMNCNSLIWWFNSLKFLKKNEKWPKLSSDLYYKEENVIIDIFIWLFSMPKHLKNISILKMKNFYHIKLKIICKIFEKYKKPIQSNAIYQNHLI